MRFFTLLLLVTLFSFSALAQAPTANFTASSTTVCQGAAITFTSTSSGSNISSYSWNFGNGETSNDQNPVYTYPNAGTYTVTLAVQNTTGQADAEVKVGYITVNESPNLSFTVAGNSCTVPINVTFTNTTSPSNGISFNWNFGNGSTSTLQQPAPVNYTAAGMYTVTLSGTNTSNNCSKTITQEINISNFQSAITVPSSVCAGVPVQFTDNSSAGANVWLWNADVAGTSTQQNPSFVFPTPGTYTVSLSSMNTNSGCSGNVSRTITVVGGTKPSFVATDSSGCAPVRVTFQNTTGATGTYSWNFGDGTNFNGQTPPAHQYNQNGSYDVTLYFTNANGCIDSLTKVGYINVSNIEAQYTATPQNGCTPLQVVFADNSTTPSTTNSPITSWTWNFGNGQVSNAQTPPTQTYTTGKYDVTLIIATANGCRDTLTQNEFIKVGFPQDANFTYAPMSSCVKSDIEFTNTSIIHPSVDTTEIDWRWDFGDDETASDKHPTHQYVKDTGYFDVQLIVDYRGCLDTLKIEDAIYIKAPISQYYLQDELFCNPTLPVTVQTVDTSKLGISTDLIDVYWKWGDGTTTHIPNADLHDQDKSSTTHNYTAHGSYTIWQIIENHTTGCVDSLDKVVHISEITGGFTLPNDSMCVLSPFEIDGSSATSTHTITSWSYDMGDGTTTGNPAEFTYQTPGTYTIVQTVTNQVGCTVTRNFNPFTALALPLADFSLSPTAGCAPLLVIATNSSTKQGNGVNLASFLWTNETSGDTQTTTNVATTVNNTFYTAGSHNVTLVATDIFGCQSFPNTQSISITKPVADFNIDAIVCNQVDVIATNASTGNPTLRYIWKIDNVVVDTLPNLTHQFNDQSAATSVNHVVSLIAIDGNGCTDTLNVPIKVSLPKANFSYAATGASVNQDGTFSCPPVFVNYTDQSTSLGSINSWQWDFYDNGNSSVNQNPSNTFVFAGTYNTSLIVTDQYGCTDDTLLVNYLVISGPKADPSYIQSLNKCGQEVAFDLGVNSSVASIEWNFGNGDSYMDTARYTYSYVTSGTFNPTVLVKDSLGCEVLYELDPVTITPNGLTAFFTYNPTEINLGYNVTFVDGSSYTLAPIANWEWHIYDNVYSNPSNANVIEYMGTPGYHDVTLIVTDQQGCKATYTKQIFVDPTITIPNVFSPNGDGVNEFVTLNYDFYQEYEIVFLNRWGNIVYHNPKQQGINLWDGTAQNGEKCIDGVYFYKFVGLLLDGITKVKAEGFVHLFGTN